MPQLLQLTEDTVLALRRIHDEEGVEAFDVAARNLFMSVGSLIGHVAGPERLMDLICMMAPDPVN